MIWLERITVAFKDGTKALDDVTLALGKTRFTVLLGPSGAGKSTLLRVANGLALPTTGSVRARDGRVLAGNRRQLAAHRRDTAMIFQQHHLVGRISALANVVNGRLGRLGRIYAVLPVPPADRRIAVSMIDRVGLLDKALVPARNLSGGEQQRVGIARALAQEPSLILADEPVASLDPATANQVLSLIDTLTRVAGIKAVVSLHQVDLAIRYADWIIGLNRGRVVFQGPPGELDPAALASIYHGAGEIDAAMCAAGAAIGIAAAAQ